LATIGKGDVVVSAKLDRAFRSAADALAVLEEMKDQGVDLHLIDLGGSVIANGMSKMVFTILAAVAEGERDIVLDGEIRRMVPNPAEMAVIERMRAMRKDGATYRAIGAVTGHGPRSVMRILERVGG
jgi:putative DNA-invertase from lambdoid prophage Rac